MKKFTRAYRLFTLFILLFGVSLFLWNCEKDELEPNTVSVEENIIEYGISKEDFMSSKTVKDVVLKFNKSNQTGIKSLQRGESDQITIEDLSERINLDDTYYNNTDSLEVINAPVKVRGNYGRELLSFTKNGINNSYLLTYPDATNKTFFYVSDLAGNLLQKVTVQDNGVGLVEKLNISNTSSRGESCYHTVYSTCSQGIHSFALGNAGDCAYWTSPGGTPPSVISYPTACGDGDGDGYHDTGDIGNNGGGSGPGTGSGDGISISPTGGGGQSNTNVTSDLPDCIGIVDCQDCNLPGDYNSDCQLNDFDTCIGNLDNTYISNFSQLNKSNKEAIENFINQSGCNVDTKNFVIEAIDIFIELDSFKDLIDDANFDPIIMPWLKWLRTLAERIESIKQGAPSLADALSRYLDRELTKALTKTAIKFNPDADLDSESRKRQNLLYEAELAIGNLLYDFANGEGADNINIYEGDFWDKFFEGNRINNIKADFETKLIEKTWTFDDFNNQTDKIDSSYNFSPDHAGVINSIEEHYDALTNNWVQFFVGGTSIEYWPSSTPNHINVILKNPTSRNSLLLHQGINYPRDGTGNNVPLSTIWQYFYITIQVR